MNIPGQALEAFETCPRIIAPAGRIQDGFKAESRRNQGGIKAESRRNQVRTFGYGIYLECRLKAPHYTLGVR